MNLDALPFVVFAIVASSPIWGFFLCMVRGVQKDEKAKRQQAIDAWSATHPEYVPPQARRKTGPLAKLVWGTIALLAATRALSEHYERQDAARDEYPGGTSCYWTGKITVCP